MKRNFVYFIQQGTDGPIKIGSSVDPQARLRALQTANPHPLRLLAKAPGDVRDERALHERFSEHRINGCLEWFSPAPDLLAHIRHANRPDRRHGRREWRPTPMMRAIQEYSATTGGRHLVYDLLYTDRPTPVSAATMKALEADCRLVDPPTARPVRVIAPVRPATEAPC